MSLDRKILNKIEKDQLRIIPRWIFALKEISDWLAVGVLLIISSLSLAMTIFFMDGARWSFFSTALSYIWLISFLGLFAWCYHKLVQVGFPYVYKLSFAVLIPVVFMTNVALGYVFYEGGQVEKIEMALEKLPVYIKNLPAGKSLIESRKEEQRKENIESMKEKNDSKNNKQMQETREDNSDAVELNQKDAVENSLQQQETNDVEAENEKTNIKIDDITEPNSKSKDNDAPSQSSRKITRVDSEESVQEETVNNKVDDQPNVLKEEKQDLDDEVANNDLDDE